MTLLRRHAWLLAALLAALLLRLGWIALCAPGALQGDQVPYDSLARAIVAGQGYAADGRPTAHYMPGWPLLLALVYALGGGFGAARVLLAVLSTAIALQAYLLGDRLVSRRAGLAAAWLAAVFPPLIWYSAVLLSETPSALVFGWWALLAVGYVQRGAGPARLAGLGLVGGVMLLFRAEMIVLVPLPFLCRALRQRGLARELAGGALAGALTLAVLMPWTLYNQQRFGERIMLTTAGGPGAWMAAHDPPLVVWDPSSAIAAHHTAAERARIVSESTEVSAALAQLWDPSHPKATDQRFAAAARALIREHPGRYLVSRLKDVPRFWLGSHTEVVASAQRSTASAWQARDYQTLLWKVTGLGSQVVLAVGSLVGLWRYGRRREMLLPLFIVLGKMAIHFPFPQFPRFSLHLGPLLLCLAAAALVWGAEKVGGWSGARGRVARLDAETAVP